MAPDLSVIFVSYNSRALLDTCLRALPGALGGRSFDVVVADNASSDGSADMVEDAWPQVRLVRMSANVGFARAVNRAHAGASGRHVLLLNPDTMPEPGSLGVLVGFLDAHARAGVVAPQLLNSDGSDQGTARAFPTPVAAFFGRRSLLTRLFPANRWSRRYLIGRQRAGSSPFEVDWVSGACLMMPRAVADLVGGLDEGFFMHWEDADLCHRIKDAGYQVWCEPGARVTHHEGGSRRGWPPRQVWAFHHGAFRYYAKHGARRWWNPLRYVAAAGLALRATALILLFVLRRTTARAQAHTLAAR